jgi:putative two-component system response regulator
VSNGRHLERLTRYSRCLAEALHDEPGCDAQIDPEFVRTLYRASALHDIGKIAIPDGILLKPGPLSHEEFSVVKTHSEIGAHMLDAAVHYSPEECFLRMAREIASAHHERWDGLGYPLGIAGDAIPLAARIVAVADIYDALTSRRVYRDAVSHTSAREIIVSESGSHLDPTVVAALFSIEQDILEIRARFKQSSAANESVACAV